MQLRQEKIPRARSDATVLRSGVQNWGQLPKICVLRSVAQYSYNKWCVSQEGSQKDHATGSYTRKLYSTSDCRVKYKYISSAGGFVVVVQFHSGRVESRISTDTEKTASPKVRMGLIW